MICVTRAREIPSLVAISARLAMVPLSISWRHWRARWKGCVPFGLAVAWSAGRETISGIMPLGYRTG